MSGDKLLLDTNALSYFMAGNEELRTIMTGKELFVSFITEMEILCNPALSSMERKKARAFLEQCHVVEMNTFIKEKAIHVRLAHRNKLPDAIIAATAFYLEIPLVSLDEGFARVKDLDLIWVKL
jgi:predicted nucleic acid-binding protein